MPKLVMHRSASDNPYLHKDFHGALSAGIEYIEQKYGPEAVREYLRQFAAAFYAPLRADLHQRGLVALKEYFEKMYSAEDGKIFIDLREHEMTLTIDECPAVAHMRAHGYTVGRLFGETSRTVNEAICEGTPYAAEMLEYDDSTGRSVQRFTRRAA